MLFCILTNRLFYALVQWKPLHQKQLAETRLNLVGVNLMLGFSKVQSKNQVNFLKYNAIIIFKHGNVTNDLSRKSI